MLEYKVTNQGISTTHRDLRLNIHFTTALDLYFIVIIFNCVLKTEMGRTCGTYGGEERCIQGFSGET
jgi:hypothetical protein